MQINPLSQATTISYWKVGSKKVSAQWFFVLSIKMYILYSVLGAKFFFSIIFFQGYEQNDKRHNGRNVGQVVHVESQSYSKESANR